MLLLHVADLHMGYRQYGLYEREEDIYRCAEEVAEIALREHVDAVIVSGDLFDQPRPPIRAVREARRLEHMLAEHGVRIYAVLGDHDTPKQRDYPPHVLLDHTRVLGTVSTPLVDELPGGPGDRPYIIAGISYQGRGRRGSRALREMLGKAASALARGVGVLAMHQGIKEFFPLDAHLSIAELPGTARYVAMGHLHKRVMHRLEEGGLLVYPGSIDIMRRDEIRDWEKNGKGPVLVDLSGDEPRAEMLSIAVRPQAIVEADYRSARWAVLEALSRLSGMPGGLKPIIHVMVSMPSIVDRNVAGEISRAVGDRAILRITLRRSAEEKAEAPAAREASEIQVLAGLLGGNERLARIVYEFKEALASRNHELAEKLADELVRDYSSHWRRLLEHRGAAAKRPRRLTDYVG